MDGNSPVRWNSQSSSSWDHHAQASGRNSTDSSSEAANGHIIVNLSPAKNDTPKIQSPRVYSVNRAREMADDRMVRITEKADRMAAENAANNLPSAKLDAIKAYIDIQKAIRQALDDDEAKLSEYRKNIKAVRKANTALEKAINDDIAAYRTGPSKQLLNAASGVVSNLLTFCVGTLLASGLDKPVASLAVIPVCWALCERFPPMLRATSWSNKHADIAYPEMMRLTERSWRDWVRQLAGLNTKKFIHKGKKVTASELRETYSLFKAWSGKVVSDDLVSYSYSLCYIVRNLSLRLATSKSFLATSAGVALSTGTLGLAGVCAGAMTALGFQAFRRSSYITENPKQGERGETLVKSRTIWAAETTLEEKKRELIKAWNAANGLEKDDAALGALRLMDADRSKASQKSGLAGSLIYEFNCLFQNKSHLGDEENGEVAGKRVQTFSGYFAKALCLLPAFLFSTYVVAVFAGSDASIGQQLGLLILAPIVLIAGFSTRKELELLCRAIVGIALGIADCIKPFFGYQDKYHEAGTPGTPATPTPSPGPVSLEASPASPQTPESHGRGKRNVVRRPDLSSPAQARVDGIDGVSDASSSIDSDEMSSASVSEPKPIAYKPAKASSTVNRNGRDRDLTSPYVAPKNKSGTQDRTQPTSSSSASSSEEIF